MDNNFLQISSSLSILTTVTPPNYRNTLTVDPSGNLWIGTSSNLYKYSSGGGLLNTFTLPSNSGSPNDIAFDSSGNLWIPGNTGVLLNMTPAGVFTAFPSISSTLHSINIDNSGNLWGVLTHGLFEWNGITNGPQVYPYSGPQRPFGTGLQ